MYNEYRDYLLNLRNNLIQNGVEFPIFDVNGYEDLFKMEQLLCEVVEFYRVLAVGGSEYILSDFMLPLNSNMKSQMRNVYYREFLDLVKDYEAISISGLKKKKYKEVESNSILENIIDGVVEDKEEGIEGVEAEGIEAVEESEVPDEEPETVDEEVPENNPENVGSFSGIGIKNTESKETVKEYVERGVSLDDDDEDDNIEYVEDKVIEGYEENGVDLNEEDYEEDNLVYEDETEGHGVDLDDEDYEEGNLVYEDESDGYGVDPDENNEEFDDAEDNIVYDDSEDGVNMDEDDNIVYDDDENNIEYDDSEDNMVYDESEDDNIEYSDEEENGYVEDEEDNFGMDLEEDDEEEVVDDDEDIDEDDDEDYWARPSEIPLPRSRMPMQQGNIYNYESLRDQRSSKADRDLSDTLQYLTNKGLNIGRKVIRNGVKKLRS